MTRRMLALGVLSFFLASPAAQAQEKYTIKVKDASQGDSYRFVNSETTKSVTKVMDSKGMTLKDTTENSGKSFIYLATIIERAPGQKTSTHFTRAYEKAVLTKEGQARTSSLEGKKVIFEKKGDKYEVRVEGGKELSPDQMADLDHNPNSPSDVSDQDIMPKQAVQLNETWNIDPALFAKGSPQNAKMFDIAKAKFTGKLVRAYKKDNAQFGTIEFQMELPMNTGPQGPGFKLESGKLVMKVTFDGCIDGSHFTRSNKGTANMEMQALQEVDGMQFVVSVANFGTLEEAWEDAKKK